ncbi:MAG: NAD(P)H-dependent oxidoreductase subunit E [Candidatus Eisenbacteria bacterium]|nr:NAD(P)H-dependent oxidoreductase subunit E [Candidatus Eisenbacteria bacterium]
MKQDDITAIVSKHGSEQGALISILEDIQTRYGYLPPDALKTVAERTCRSLVDVYGIATFYRAFSLKPRGKHLCSVCVGTACHVRGAPRIATEFERQLRVEAGETTADKEFSLETVNCLGACALGPIVVVNGRYFSNVSSARVKTILDQARSNFSEDAATAGVRIFPVEVSCPRCNHSLMDPDHLIDGHPSVRVTISFGDKHGWLRLSSLYGSYSFEHEHEIEMDTIAHFFCPHCHTELVGASNCQECGAPMVPMIVRPGGMIQICSRRGCKGHMLDLDGVNL